METTAKTRPASSEPVERARAELRGMELPPEAERSELVMRAQADHRSAYVGWNYGRDFHNDCADVRRSRVWLR